MDFLFDKILDMSFTAIWLILTVIFVRILFQKAPKYIRCIMWALVAIRLVCPFSIETAFSLVPSMDSLQLQVNDEDNVNQDSLITENEQIDDGNVVVDDNTQTEEKKEQEDYIIDEEFVGTGNDDTDLVEKVDNVPVNVLSIIWLFGMAVILLHSVISYFRLKKRVSTSTYYDDRIWVSDEVETPLYLVY